MEELKGSVLTVGKTLKFDSFSCIEAAFRELASQAKEKGIKKLTVEMVDMLDGKPFKSFSMEKTSGDWKACKC